MSIKINKYFGGKWSYEKDNKKSNIRFDKEDQPLTVIYADKQNLFDNCSISEILFLHSLKNTPTYDNFENLFMEYKNALKKDLSEHVKSEHVKSEHVKYFFNLAKAVVADRTDVSAAYGDHIEEERIRENNMEMIDNACKSFVSQIVAQEVLAQIEADPSCATFDRVMSEETLTDLCSLDSDRFTNFINYIVQILKNNEIKKLAQIDKRLPINEYINKSNAIIGTSAETVSYIYEKADQITKAIRKYETKVLEAYLDNLKEIQQSTALKKGDVIQVLKNSRVELASCKAALAELNVELAKIVNKRNGLRVSTRKNQQQLQAEHESNLANLDLACAQTEAKIDALNVEINSINKRNDKARLNIDKTNQQIMNAIRKQGSAQIEVAGLESAQNANQPSAE